MSFFATGRKLLLCLCLIASAANTGCLGVSDAPALGLVSGTILMEGEPVSGVRVTFHPDQGRPAFGITNASGQYELTYIRETRGCKVGHCRVVLGSGEEGLDNTAAEGDGTAQFETAADEKGLPAKYTTASTLEAEVKPGKNVINFNLTK
ncbi:hypothetical protein Plim_4234 [Planctopirus limnophila DSM 3776]|uniref:Carboxypeptidase regulatory-like domain-containing protein n=1 Tax=Planctopirus limnophila (strain ATCC 43296 / DSM 3776 / IFAM 1008 / Mu 290) TaxID=521674 RepID=D5SN08_PLAL2|nr:hypothetical protein [Planctopirus limnophila]ADG70041.1 hypothetical protein Plim_4234 [Planctopirus limnophila DSM 3776]